MDSFRKYLEHKGYKHDTVADYLRMIRHFKTWCDHSDVNPSIATLDDLYDYKEHCMNKGYSLNYTKHRIVGIQHYYDALGRNPNPASLMKQGRKEVAIPKSPLSSEEMKDLYQNQEACTITQKREVVMLGIFLFQGVRIDEIKLLTIRDIDLERGIISLPKTATTNARNIPLATMQIPKLMTYLYEVRPKLLQEAGKQSDLLFFSTGKGSSLQSAITGVQKRLKRSHTEATCLRYIRQSRVSHWVKELGMRKAQYFSGMKYVSSLLRYQVKDTDSLKRALEVVHPLERRVTFEG
jgi:site-specific recombinase XerD